MLGNSLPEESVSLVREGVLDDTEVYEDIKDMGIIQIGLWVKAGMTQRLQFQRGADIDIDIEAPLVLLAATKYVPLSKDYCWRLFHEECSGTIRSEFYSAALPLKTRPELDSLLRILVNEEFCKCAGSGRNLATGASERDRFEYRRVLAAYGLTVSDDLLQELRQPVYPMDATDDNFKKLTGSSLSLDQVLGPQRRDDLGLKLVVVGPAIN